MESVAEGESVSTRKIQPRGMGTVEWVPAKMGEERGHYRGRISLADGSRPWITCPPGPRSKQAEDKARQFIGHEAERAKKNELRAEHFGIVPRGSKCSARAVATANGTETVASYAERWLKAREGRIASTESNRGHLDRHILPVIGPHAMTAVTAKEIEDLVAALDVKVAAGELNAKTARNIWGTCSKMFDDATHAKPSAGLRCLERDPTDGVRGPDDDAADKALQFLYPSEFSTFVACEDVPLRWRRAVALAVYLCLRDGEQRALAWPQVDLVHGIVTVSETYDRAKGAVREGTKGGAARVVPIRPELVPLLEAMKKGAKDKGLVCELPPYWDTARGLRRWLKRAGVDRVQLHEGTSVSKQLRWHDMRATGLTWLAVEGRPPTEIRDVAGHAQTSMTDRYMRAAGILRSGRFGRPFPTLPASLYSGPGQCGNCPGTDADDLTTRNDSDAKGCCTRSICLVSARFARLWPAIRAFLTGDDEPGERASHRARERRPRSPMREIRDSAGGRLGSVRALQMPHTLQTSQPTLWRCQPMASV